MPEGVHRLLNRSELTKIAGLTIGSRFTVEGSLQGAHKSPLKGFSIEFADYRPYVKGDDLRHLDWKAFARNERLYIKQYEEESNLRIYLLVDGSKSMAFGYGDTTKYQFASRLAAGLAYITVQQQDSVGLTLFDQQLIRQIPARSTREHLRLVGDTLADHKPAHATNIAQTLHRLAEGTRRRALIILISDLFDDVNALQKALAHFKRRKHDVVIFHVLDPAEINFPFRDLGNFRDLETGETLLTDPRSVRHAYQEAVYDFLYQARRLCAGLDIDYALSTTDRNVPDFLRQHLGRRSRRGR